MKKHADSIDAAILGRIQTGVPGDVFAPTDFLDLGSRAAVDQALSRNCRAGLIRKASRGLYDVPHSHPLIGPLSSSPDAVIKAIARRDGMHPRGWRTSCARLRCRLETDFAMSLQPPPAVELGTIRADNRFSLCLVSAQ